MAMIQISFSFITFARKMAKHAKTTDMWLGLVLILKIFNIK